MLRPELTPEDRNWLAQQAEAIRLSCDFMLHDLFHQHSPGFKARAANVPIWLDGRYVPAGSVLKQIEERVPHSQIFEQWEARVYEDVQRACKRLSPQDARALIVTAGFHEVTESEINRAADEAVREAWADLYGEPEGSFDEYD